MSGLKLSLRLNAIAKLVPLFGSVADVGTDHGYIPVWLAQNGHTGTLFATDISKDPLEHAKRTAAEYGLVGQIRFFLCNGLEALNGNDIDTVIICGMGGETIAEILSAALWTKESGHLLILQPMSKSSYLRSWLFDNGYKVLSEALVEDGLVYEILTVAAGKDVPYSPAELLIGHRQLIFSDPLYSDRLSFLTERASRAKAGLTASSRAEDGERLKEINELIASLSEL